MHSLPEGSDDLLRGGCQTAIESLQLTKTLASITAVRYDAGLKQYYERKVAEGKNKMSVLNAVKSKLLARVVSCVNNSKMYVKMAA